MNKIGLLETLLFAAGEEGISLEEVAHYLELTTNEAYECIETLAASYVQSEASGLHILEVANHFMLSTKKEAADLLKDFAKSASQSKLSQATLETMAIIAYKQPITRSEVDEIRGVQSSGSIQKLVVHGLIEGKGRVEGPGRAILYGTTKEFLAYFGLNSFEELPSIEEMEATLNAEEPVDLFFNRFKESFAELEEISEQENTTKPEINGEEEE